MYDQKAVLYYRFNSWKRRRRRDKLTIGTVPHVVQSPDSDSNAFFMVIETTVDAHPGGGVEKRPKTSFHHSSTGRQQTCEFSTTKQTNVNMSFRV
jgi:hypothetical protein